MKSFRTAVAVACPLLHCTLVTARMVADTGESTALYGSQSPYHIYLNSSSLATVPLSSTTLIGTGMTTIIVFPTNISSSASDTPTSLSDSTLLVPQSSASSLAPTATTTSAALDSVLTHAPSSTATSATTTDCESSSVSEQPAASYSSMAPVLNDPSSQNLTVWPPKATDASSTSIAVPCSPEITPAPPSPMDLLPSETQVQSIISEVSTMFASVFPHIQAWIDHPSAPNTVPVIHGLENALHKAIDLLAKLPKPLDGVEPCKPAWRHSSKPDHVTLQSLNKEESSGETFKTAFSLVNCIVHATKQIKFGVVKGTPNAVELVKRLKGELESMVGTLKEVKSNPNEQPGSTHCKPHSSSTCTLRTDSDCSVGCVAIATVVPGRRVKMVKGDACTTVCKEPVTICEPTGATANSTMTSTISAHY